MQDEIGVAVVGCGYWGVNYLRVFSELPGARLVAVCDQRSEPLAEIRRRFPATSVTTSLEHALELDGVEAAVVCTQPGAHFEIARRCLETGRHTLVEKPMTTCEADGQALIALAAAKDLTLMVGHTFLYNAAIRKVKEYIAGGQMH
jgi:predicted dehydrogenase